jgi:hypothetical protein
MPQENDKREDDKRRAARIRAVATLIERYFAQLREELAATRDAFFKRIEHVFASPPPDAPSGNASPGKPPDSI